VRAAALTRTAAEFGSSLTIRSSSETPQPRKDLDGEFADKTIVDRLGDGKKRAPSLPGLTSRVALRVAVATAPSDSTVLMVRVLAEGQPVPSGAHEAILVALEPGADFFRPKV
jgi:hypothetical protein